MSGGAGLLSQDMLDAIDELRLLILDLTPEGRRQLLSEAQAVVEDESIDERSRAYAVTVQIGTEEIERGRDPGPALIGVYGAMAAHESGRREVQRRAMRAHSGRRRRGGR